MVVFDKFYEEYDEWYDTKIGKFIDKLQTQTAFNLLNPVENDFVLDVGCGTGNFSFKLDNLGCKVQGIDISKNMLKIAKNKIKANSNIQFDLIDSSNLIFPDNHFDKIISMAAFEFMPNPDTVFSELIRVLKPGGKLVIGTIQKNSLWYDFYKSPIFKNSAYSDAIFQTKDDIISLGKSHYVDHKECLFIPPNIDESKYNSDMESHYKSKFNKGGFVCVMFQK